MTVSIADLLRAQQTINANIKAAKTPADIVEDVKKEKKQKRVKKKTPEPVSTETESSENEDTKD